MDLLEKVKATIIEHGLVSRGDTVIVAVSGGADSTALVHLLAALRDTWNLRLVAAHLDHRLRRGSGKDARFVAGVAERLDIRIVVAAENVRALARRRRLSIEEAGREARYAFFAEQARAHGAECIATGHTRDDDTETVLMRLLRGDPWDALRGIPVTRSIGVTRVIRPLLGITREEIRSYLSAQSIRWLEDPSNRDLRFMRNWIRLRVLPTLELEAPRVRDVLLELSSAIRSADRLLIELAQHRAGEVSEIGAQLVRMPLAEFRRHPQDIQRRMLRWAVGQVTGTPDGLPIVLEERGLSVAAKGRVGELADLGAVEVRTNYDALEVTRPQPPARGEYRLSVPGTVEAEAFGVTLSADIVDSPAPVRPPSVHTSEVYFDAASIGYELRIRAWRPGDRIMPLGMRGKKKVQDLFVDEKVPRWERHRIPLVTDPQGRIIWIVGLRISEAGRITDRTRRVVRLAAHPRSAAAIPAPNAPDDAVVGLA